MREILLTAACLLGVSLTAAQRNPEMPFSNRDNRLVETYVFAAFVYFVICAIGTPFAKRISRVGRTA